ncbi:Hypothetical predicted protein [Mytilus galloprovincialis]|uniref:Reverse transcriptase domain-containing protein n=1 Tax=Mytilus galloprovincialis TaxID=29158 RepID=A0A8B6G8I8_MYTGA|nr:Hypothetical predicted protein [Mytilus galloprovincialis]
MLLDLIGDKSKLPDHSVIMCEFNVTHHGLSYRIKDQTNCQPRFKLDRIPLDFMASDIRRSALFEVIETIERCRETQDNVDKIYDNLCTVILTEMNEKIPKTGYDRANKRLKNRKPYWNDNLTNLWNDMRHKENEFIQCNGNRSVKSAIRREYSQARDVFDKNLRRTERTYKKAMAVDIETMVTTNPNEFWEKIKKLGPRKVKDIPMEVVGESEEILSNEEDVLNKWRIDFENLYNGKNNIEFENDHYNQSKVHKQLLESEMEDPLFIPNEDLNSNITIDEITKIVMHAKSKSASGPDQIPYGVLKYPVIIQTLQQLFQLIFDTSIIPTIWRKAIICPILKDPLSDLRVPMNYRGISLLSCTSKLYSSFINQRLVSHLDNNDILADEQNGFRKKQIV